MSSIYIITTAIIESGLPVVSLGKKCYPTFLVIPNKFLGQPCEGLASHPLVRGIGVGRGGGVVVSNIPTGFMLMKPELRNRPHELPYFIYIYFVTRSFKKCMYSLVKCRIAATNWFQKTRYVTSHTFTINNCVQVTIA